jgi:hypothetical protein
LAPLSAAPGIVLHNAGIELFQSSALPETQLRWPASKSASVVGEKKER